MARQENASSASTIVVKIAPLMGEVKEFVLAIDSTIANALDNAGYDSGSEVRVTTASGENQTITNNDAKLDDGDLITVIAAGKVEAGK